MRLCIAVCMRRSVETQYLLAARLCPDPAGPVMLCCHASTLLSPAQESTIADHNTAASCNAAALLPSPGSRTWGSLLDYRNQCSRSRQSRKEVCALVSILKDSHIVELSSLNSHAGVAGQVKRKYDLAMSALGDQVRALSTLHICASLYEVQQS